MTASGTGAVETGVVQFSISGGAPSFTVTNILTGVVGLSADSTVTIGNSSIVVSTKDPTTKQFLFFYRLSFVGTGSATDVIKVTDSLGTSFDISVTATAS